MASRLLFTLASSSFCEPELYSSKFLKAEVLTGDVPSNGKVAGKNCSCDGQGAAAVMCFSR